MDTTPIPATSNGPAVAKKRFTATPKETAVFCIFGAIIALLYTWCFSGITIYPQLSFTLFCPVAFVLLALALQRLGYLQNKKALLWAIPIAIVAAFNGIFSLNPFTYGNVLLMHAMFAAFALNAMQPKLPDMFSMTGAFALLSVLHSHWLVWFEACAKLKKAKADKTTPSVMGKVLVGVLLAFPLLTIVTMLLVSADQVFGKLLNNLVAPIIHLEFTNLPTLLSFVLVFMYASGYMYNSKAVAAHVEPLPFPTLPTDKIIAATVLTLLNAVFLLFSFVQVAYLFTGGLMTLPEGMVYSEYAREGFFQLLFVTVINFSVLIAFMSVLRGAKDIPLVRLLLTLLCLFTGVLIASSFYRMFLYIDAYGYTPLRLCVVTFLVMEVFWTAIALGKLYRDNVPFIKGLVMTGFVFYLIVNVTGSQYFSTRLNVKLLQTGQLDRLSQWNVGADGMHLLQPLLDSGDYVCIYNALWHKDSAPETEIQNQEEPWVSPGWDGEWQNWSYFKAM